MNNRYKRVLMASGVGMVASALLAIALHFAGLDPLPVLGYAGMLCVALFVGTLLVWVNRVGQHGPTRTDAY